MHSTLVFRRHSIGYCFDFKWNKRQDDIGDLDEPQAQEPGSERHKEGNSAKDLLDQLRYDALVRDRRMAERMAERDAAAAVALANRDAAIVTKLESLMKNLSESVDIKIKHLSDTVDGKYGNS